MTNVCEANSLQSDLNLNSLIQWTDQWQMKFNFEKCKIMHIRHRNIQHTYEMNGHVLHTVESEKDLGVIIRSDLKASDQCASAYAKASKVVGNKCDAKTV